MSKNEILYGIDPEEWKRLFAIAEAYDIPEYNGACLCCGKDYRDQPEGFIRWVEDHCYAEDWDTKEYKPFRPEEWQKQEIRKAFAVNKKGILKYKVIFLCWPKRHGKTQIAAYYDLYRSMNFRNQQVSISSNSVQQTTGTAYRWVCKTLHNSPSLRKMVDDGLIKMTTTYIRFLHTGSEINLLTSAPESAMGRKDSVAHLTEGHKAKNSELHDALSGGTGDTKNGVTIEDTHVGEDDNFIFEKLEQFKNGSNPANFFSLIQYKDLKDAIKRGPKWIDPDFLRGKAADLLSSDFKKFHLNQGVTSGSRVFDEEKWKACAEDKPKAPLSIADLEKHFFPRMINGAGHFGVGLDRAGISENANRTILTLIVKGFPKKKGLFNRERDTYGDGEVQVVEQCIIPGSDDDEIRSILKRWKKTFHWKNFAPEDKEIIDLAIWCNKRGLPCEVFNPQTKRKDDAVARVNRLVNKGHLHFHRDICEGLLYHEGLKYQINPSGAKRYGYSKEFEDTITVGGETRKMMIKDDTVDSLLCAVWGLRNKIKPPPSRETLKGLNPTSRESTQLINAYMKDL